MSIYTFFTVSIANSRPTWVANKSTLVAVGTFMGHVQQASPEYTIQIGEACGLVFSVWCPKGTDVATGDKLTIATGDYAGTYSVRGVQKNATGENEHLELVTIKDVT